MQEEEYLSFFKNNLEEHFENEPTLYLHQFKLMTSNGFGMPLILLGKIDKRNSATWEGLPRTTSGVWKQ